MTPITKSDFRVCAGVFALAMLASLFPARASTFKVLHSFSAGTDGCYPASGSLILDKNGNLFGTTIGGAAPCNQGNVFEFAQNGAETVLYNFAGGNGGAAPEALVMDKKDSLWGTASSGGKNGGGLIFKINARGRESVVHSFVGPPNDGCDPLAAMVADTSGNFYGTTFGCGKYNSGTVFKLASDGSESLSYSFRGGHDGLYPVAGLIMDAQNNLYGATNYGGRVRDCSDGFGGCGTIYRLAPDGTKTILYGFKGSPNDGYLPIGNVIMDAFGNIFGTTEWGGRAGCFANEGCGIVFKLAPGGTETVLHYFAGERSDGANSAAGLIADSAGNFYGTTEFGGGDAPCNGADGCGTAFKIAPDGTETILHKFKEATDGANPIAGLAADGAGNLYGTANHGGAFGYGTVFEIAP